MLEKENLYALLGKWMYLCCEELIDEWTSESMNEWMENQWLNGEIMDSRKWIEMDERRDKIMVKWMRESIDAWLSKIVEE